MESNGPTRFDRAREDVGSVAVADERHARVRVKASDRHVHVEQPLHLVASHPRQQEGEEREIAVQRCDGHDRQPLALSGDRHQARDLSRPVPLVANPVHDEDDVVDDAARLRARYQLARRICADRQQVKQVAPRDGDWCQRCPRAGQRIDEAAAPLKSDVVLAHLDDVEVARLRNLQIEKSLPVAKSMLSIGLTISSRVPSSWTVRAGRRACSRSASHWSLVWVRNGAPRRIANSVGLTGRRWANAVPRLLESAFSRLTGESVVHRG